MQLSTLDVVSALEPQFHDGFAVEDGAVPTGSTAIQLGLGDARLKRNMPEIVNGRVMQATPVIQCGAGKPLILVHHSVRCQARYIVDGTLIHCILPARKDAWAVVKGHPTILHKNDQGRSVHHIVFCLTPKTVLMVAIPGRNGRSGSYTYHMVEVDYDHVVRLVPCTEASVPQEVQQVTV